MTVVPSYALDVLVYGGFNMMLKLRPVEGDIENVTCSCGWSLNCNGLTDVEAVEVAKEHATHINYRKVLTLYADRHISYDGAVGFLVMLGMSDERAEQLIDEGLQ
jgi:hypothetical protein